MHTRKGLDDALYAANRHLAALKTRGPASPAELRAAAERVERIHAALRTSASELAELARMYLWSVEFGLTGTPTDALVAGAALFSATLEMKSIVEGRATLRPYSIDVVKVDIEFTDPKRATSSRATSDISTTCSASTSCA